MVLPVAHPLDGVRAKLTRANRHAEELGREITAWNDRYPYGHTSEFDPDTSTYVFRYRIFEPPPPSWSVIIGDIVHNLASALDHLAWQLVILNGCEPIERQTAFPIFKDETHWKSSERNGGQWMMEGMSEFHKLALGWYQPCRDDEPEEHALMRLRQLWNFDKHRTLTPVLGKYGPGATIKLHAVRDVQPGTFTGGSTIPIGPIEDNAKFARVPIIPSGPNPTIYLDGEVTVDILFGEGCGPAGERVDETLAAIYNYVSGVFQELASGFR
jgi:hypothetical protein